MNGGYPGDDGGEDTDDEVLAGDDRGSDDDDDGVLAGNDGGSDWGESV